MVPTMIQQLSETCLHYDATLHTVVVMMQRDPLSRQLGELVNRVIPPQIDTETEKMMNPPITACHLLITLLA